MVTKMPPQDTYTNIKQKLLFRRIAAEIISRLPFSPLRCWLYSRLGYKIKNCTIGRGSVIAIEALEMVDSQIGNHNKIVGPFRMSMGKQSAIGSSNNIVSGLWALREDHSRFNYKRELIFEERAVATMHHWFDVIDRIRIGAGTHIAGIGSQFWTHGYTSSNRDIDIGVDCFVGSGCIFNPGSGLGDRSIVGSGSVITKKYRKHFCILSGNSAEIRREDYYWRTRRIVDLNNPPPLPESIQHLAVVDIKVDRPDSEIPDNKPQ